ncbi:MAG: hypothetical protein WCO89_14010, partial [Syntrophus sp. (in: bacteria)]
DKNGEVQDDGLLPAVLTAAWQEDENNQGKPFPSFARLLTQRGTAEGESPYSWTVDFAARRAYARKEMQPYLDEAERIKEQVVTLKEQLKALKKDKGGNGAVEALEAEIKEQEKAARDARSKADDIDAAVYDLKAVNPNAVVKTDNRTPAKIIENIEAQGKIVAAALDRLKTLLEESI